MSKLSCSDIEYIQNNPDKLSQSELARKFGVSITTIGYHTKRKLDNDKCNTGRKHKWTDEDIATLKKWANSKNGVAKICKITGRSEIAVRNYAYKIGVRLKGKRNAWTNDEVNILKNNIGKSISYLSILTHHNHNAVKSKLSRLGIGNRAKIYADKSVDMILVSEFKRYMGINDSMFGLFKRNGLEVVDKFRHRPMVSIRKALKWMKSHQDLFDASKIEMNVFIPEPEWLIKKRKIDSRNGFKQRFQRKDQEEIKRLFLNGCSYKEIREKTGACNTSIHNIVCSLNSENKGKKYSLEDINYIKENMDNMTSTEMAFKLGRTLASVSNMVSKVRRGMIDESKLKSKREIEKYS